MTKPKKLILILISILIVGILLYYKNHLSRIANQNLNQEIKTSTVKENFNFSDSYSDNSLYDIYITDYSNEVSLAQIKSISSSGVDYSVIRNIPTNYEDAQVLYIGKDSNNKIYVSHTKSLNSEQEYPKLFSFKNGKYTGEVKLENTVYPNNIISDVENNKLYVQQLVYGSNPDGLSIDIVDTNSSKVIKTINLKGYIQSFNIDDNNIVISLEGAHKLDYSDSLDRSIYLINRKTLEVNCITKESLPLSVSGVSSDNDNIFIFSRLDLVDGNWLTNNKVTLMNLNGEIIRTIPSPYEVFGSYHGSNNKVYLKLGLDPMVNNGLVVFDMNKEEFIKVIDNIQNVTDICELDSKLFVLTRNGDVYIYDSENYNLIGSLNVGKINLGNFTVIKK